MTLSRFWSRHADQTFVKPKPAATTVFNASGHKLDTIGRLVGCPRYFEDSDGGELDGRYRQRIVEHIVAQTDHDNWLHKDELVVRAAVCGIALTSADIEEDHNGSSLCINTACLAFLGTGEHKQDEDYDESTLAVLIDEYEDQRRAFEDFEFEEVPAEDTGSHEIVEMDIEELPDDSINQPACRHCGQPYIDCTCEEFRP